MQGPSGTISPPSLVVIGPSGSGKSTLGRAIADRLGLAFLEGDDYHPAANLEKMARGQALSDRDREPFLDAVGEALAQQESGAVAACSALKRSHRERLLRRHPALTFIWPRVPPEELERRMNARRAHFMPSSLLTSQLDAFEVPQEDGNCLIVDGKHSIAEQVQAIEEALARRPG